MTSLTKPVSQISLSEFNQIITEDLPFAADVGIALENIEEGFASVRLPYSDRTIRPGGTISGPHMMMLADICMYAVLMSKIGIAKMAVTTNLNINFLRKPSESDLIAEGSIIKVGKRLAIMEVSIYSQTSDQEKDHDRTNIVAHATGTFSIPPQEG